MSKDNARPCLMRTPEMHGPCGVCENCLSMVELSADVKAILGHNRKELYLESSPSLAHDVAGETPEVDATSMGVFYVTAYKPKPHPPALIAASWQLKCSLAHAEITRLRSALAQVEQEQKSAEKRIADLCEAHETVFLRAERLEVERDEARLERDNLARAIERTEK